MNYKEIKEKQRYDEPTLSEFVIPHYEHVIVGLYTWIYSMIPYLLLSIPILGFVFSFKDSGVLDINYIRWILMNLLGILFVAFIIELFTSLLNRMSQIHKLKLNNTEYQNLLRLHRRYRIAEKFRIWINKTSIVIICLLVAYLSAPSEVHTLITQPAYGGLMVFVGHQLRRLKLFLSIYDVSKTNVLISNFLTLIPILISILALIISILK